MADSDGSRLCDSPGIARNSTKNLPMLFQDLGEAVSVAEAASGWRMESISRPVHEPLDPSPIVPISRSPDGESPHWAVYCADARSALLTLDPGTVNCVVTSPPYYWQRD